MGDTNINKLIYKKAQEIASKYCGHDDPPIQRERYQAVKTGFIGGANYIMKLLSERDGFDNNVEKQEDTVSENAKQYIAERSDVAECFPLQREFHVCSWATARKGAKIAENDMKQKSINAHKLTCRHYIDGKCDILCYKCSKICVSHCQSLNIKECKSDCGYMKNFISLINS